MNLIGTTFSESYLNRLSVIHIRSFQRPAIIKHDNSAVINRCAINSGIFNRTCYCFSTIFIYLGHPEIGVHCSCASTCRIILYRVTIIVIDFEINLNRIGNIYTDLFLISYNIRLGWFKCCCITCSERSGRNQSQHECCHGSQRYNLLRDLIQNISLPINFLRNLAPPQWGAGLFLLHPAWSVPHFSCTSFSFARVFRRQNKKPSAFAGLAARFRPVRPRPRQRLRPGLVESSRLGDMLWLYSPFR